MNTIIENGMTISAIGTTAYIAYGFLMKYAVEMYTALSLILVN